MTDKRGEEQSSKQDETQPEGFDLGMLVAVIASTALASMGITVTSLIAPQLAVTLSATPLQISWLVNGFMTALAATVLLAGALANRYGRKNTLIAGNIIGALFLMVSCVPNANIVIIGRLGCGVAAAMILPVSLSVISALTPGKSRVTAIALWSALGLSFGPVGNLVSGGLVALFGWWGLAYLWSVPVLLVAAFLVYRFVPERCGEVKGGAVDWIGGALSIASITLLVYVLSALSGGLTSALAVMLAASLLGFVVLYFYERRHASPLVRPDLFKARPLAMAAVCALVVYGSLFGGLYIAIQYMSSVLAYSTLQASAGALPISVVSMLLGAVAGKMVQKYGSRVVIMAGLVFIAAGFLIMLTWGAASSYILLAATFTVFGVGTGLCGPPIAAAYMSSVTEADSGMASGIQDVAKDLGGAVGIALFGSIFALRYSKFFGTIDNQSEAYQSVHSLIGTSFSGANIAAQKHPEYASQILAAAKEAFLSGATSAIVIGVVLVVVSIIGVWFLFPNKTNEEEFYASVLISKR